MTARLDDLVRDLGADLKPVRPLWPPLVRASCWLGAVAATALILASFSDLPGVARRLQALPDVRMGAVGSTLTMVLAAIAVFQLSLPDRKPAWALLPLPALALWVAGTGLGCLRSLAAPDLQAATMRETGHCFMFIVSLSVPLSLALVWMVRRGCALRPNLTAATGGLAAAAAAATLLNFFHPFDAGAGDLAVHVAAIGLVIGLNRELGGRLLRQAASDMRL